MIQIKLFESHSKSSIESTINEFLSELGPENEVKDIRHEMETNPSKWTVMVIYDKKN